MSALPYFRKGVVVFLDRWTGRAVSDVHFLALPTPIRLRLLLICRPTSKLTTHSTRRLYRSSERVAVILKRDCGIDYTGLSVRVTLSLPCSTCYPTDCLPMAINS